MKSLQRFPSQHGDFVHDVSFDYYGRRLATGSSDRTVKIWEQDERGNWKNQAACKAHQGAVWKVSWAHPEFGQVLASASFDRTVIVWEEREGEVCAANGQPSPASWTQRCQLTGSSGSIQDVAFGPRHHGLVMASCGADGVVRVYEAANPLDLTCFDTLAEFGATESVHGLLSLCWCPSPFHAPMLLLADHTPTPQVVWSNTGCVTWEEACVLEGHSEPVVHVAWAPHLGRSFHLVATASLDGTARVWRLRHVDPVAHRFNGRRGEAEMGGQGIGGALEVVGYEELKCDCEVWRVEWNVTGSMLATAGDDGTTRLWRADFKGKWSVVSRMAGDLFAV